MIISLLFQALNGSNLLAKFVTTGAAMFCWACGTFNNMESTEEGGLFKVMFYGLVGCVLVILGLTI